MPAGRAAPRAPTSPARTLPVWSAGGSSTISLTISVGAAAAPSVTNTASVSAVEFDPNTVEQPFERHGDRDPDPGCRGRCSEHRRGNAGDRGRARQRHARRDADGDHLPHRAGARVGVVRDRAARTRPLPASRGRTPSTTPSSTPTAAPRPPRSRSPSRRFPPTSRSRWAVPAERSRWPTSSLTAAVRNGGPGSAADVQVTLAVPSRLAVRPATVSIDGVSAGSACVVAGSVITCSLGSLASGSVVHIAWTATVSASAPAGPLVVHGRRSVADHRPRPGQQHVTGDDRRRAGRLSCAARRSCR